MWIRGSGLADVLVANGGAGSRAVAEAMAAGALDRSQAQLAISITGFAGPAGEDDEEGLVHLALAGADGSRRFNELRRDIPGISQRMLTRTLRGLERDGLVSRTVTPSVPPRVDYALTALGRSLCVPVAQLGNWAVANIGKVEAARAVYDGGQD